MFANRQGSRLKRRGIVLVLILGMLSLLALIGVTFATFAGQSLINNRNYAFGISRPNAEQLMDYALSQLINDTNNPLSSLRGHSLLRDMYGNDSVFRGNNPQNSTNSQTRGLLTQVPSGSGQVAPQITGARPYAQYNSNSPLAGRYLQFATNIPTARLSYAFYGLNFTRWIVRLNSGNGVNQTFEVIEDDDTGNDVFSGGYHLLTLSNNLGAPVGAPFLTTNSDYLTRVFKNLNVNLAPDDTTPNVPKKSQIGLAPSVVNFGVDPNPTFVLDGRFMRAFNGPGMSRRLMTDPVMYTPPPTTPPVLNAVPPNVNTQFINYSVPFNVAAYANFRLNGTLIQRNLPADGSSTGSVSTLGDPDLIGMDEDYDACDLENWFLAIQSADGEVMIPSFHRPGILTKDDWKVLPAVAPYVNIMGAAKILRPRQGDNSPLFPADPLPAADGKIKYDVDNDGDGVSDSVWLDLGYPVLRDPGGKIYKPLFAFMVLGQNGRLPLNTVGNLQARDWQTAQTHGGTNVYPNNYPDAPLWDHASHLGASVNEINPKYALQNAPANVYGAGYTQADSTPVQGATLSNGIFGSPLFNNNLTPGFAGVPVDLTQLRNILTGTYPHENPRAPDFNKNGERNFVLVDGQNYYLPNNVADSTDAGYGTTPLTANVNRGGVSPVAGRWGEIAGIPYQLNVRPELQVFYNNFNGTTGQTVVDFNNPVRAGRSFYTDSSGSFNRINSIDSFDDDFDANDPDIQQLSSLLTPIRSSPYPARVPREEFEVEDNAGGLMLPVERERRFVNPRDPVGVGRLTSRNNRPNDAQDFGNGYDTRGRVSFFRYFRPPGVPQQVTYPATSTVWPLDQFNMAFMNGVATPNLSNNLLHGYESMRNPLGTPEQIAVAGAMPYNMNYDWTDNTNPKKQPPANPIVAPVGGATPNLYSYDNYVSTDSGPYGVTISGPSFTVANGYPMGGLNKDEADEMNLYTPSLADSPFGPSDIEWLYRIQDVDGATLDSRLARLAPISFLNPADGLTRRRLFSLESWDLNNFAYASDNPDNSNPWNSRFGQFANASFPTMNQVPALDGNFNVVDPTANPVIYPTTGPAANAYTTLFLPNPTFEAPIAAYRPNPNASVTALPLDLNVALQYGGNGRHSNWSLNSGDPSAYPMQTPAAAHRDRRINLNQPLPVSNDPAEPVRQKWVRETYQFLKAVLPPQSVDTPQELAALSQYVVNIVDFRDPDCSMTRFVNTDLEVVPATASSHADVRFARIGVPAETTLAYGDHHFPYDPTIYNEQIRAFAAAPTTWWDAIDARMTAAGLPTTPKARFLVQHGMEYNPIALNEVLAYQTSYKQPPGTPQVTAGNNLAQTSRIFIELVNTLTDANGNGASDVNIGLNGAGYDLVIAPDNDATCRPSPITGDLTNEITPAPTAAGDPVQYHSLINNTVIPAIPAATPNYFVLTSPLVGTATINNEREEIPSADLAKFTTAVNNQLPAQFAPRTVTGNGSYYWLYLRRSANPFDPTSTEKVVVDAIRFPVVNTIAQGTSVYDPSNQTTTFRDAGSAGTNQVYSIQRLQPYRGGHKVGANGTAPVPPVGAYGYSEETAPSSNNSNWYSRYYGRDTNNVANDPATSHRSSRSYFHTLGAENNPRDNDWDYLAFNDRDFASVAELLLVPGCPPGLFTKQFVEEDYPGRNATPFNDTTLPATTPPSGNNIGGALAAGELRTFPYLSDKFYYNAASVNPFPTSPMPAGEKYAPRVGEMTGAGWHKMLEFFEVPSSANGAIGSVASGDNFDWYREDRKPGLLNLNLIIDEEVFFGLIDDPRLNSFLAMFDYQNPTPPVSQAFLPQVVTLVDPLGFPAIPANTGFNGVHPISTIQSTFPDNVVAVRPSGVGTPGETSGGNGQPTLFSAGRGFSRWDPRLVTSVTPNFQIGYVHGLKAAFSDFLKVRHGGSGFLFAYGAGLPGAGGDVYLPVGTPLGRVREALAAERPFRSLSYPDINMTVMRPAALPASLKTFPNLGNAVDEVHPDLAPPYTWLANDVASLPQKWATNGTTNPFVGDPGVKNPHITTSSTTARIPLVPSRRLFQIPDSNAGSNASVNGQGPTIMQQVQDGNLSVIESSLVDSFRNVLLPFPANQNAFPGHAEVRGNLLGSGGPSDNRQHPAYRIEWLQKVMNLTTVRTHQFAVWITIGFFEVLKAGSPTVGVPDVLGQELGAAAGKNVRYRSFFLLDRTRAAGFNPYNPGDFRDVVTYRRRIE